MTGEAPDTQPTVDAEAVTAVATEIAEAIARHFARRPANHSAVFEPLNALAIDTGQLIASMDERTQEFFEACLAAQIRRSLENRLLTGEPEGEA